MIVLFLILSSLVLASEQKVVAAPWKKAWCLISGKSSKVNADTKKTLAESGMCFGLRGFGANPTLYEDEPSPIGDPNIQEVMTRLANQKPYALERKIKTNPVTKEEKGLFNDIVIFAKAMSKNNQRS